MYTFKTIIEDFERPLNTSLEDSIHMPQNHNNRLRRRSRRYPEHKHVNNAGVVQATNVVQATGVVPPEQRHVAPIMMGSGDGGRGGSGCLEIPHSHVSIEGSGRNRPTMKLDARVCGAEERGEKGRKVPYSRVDEAPKLVIATDGKHRMPNATPQGASPTRVMFGKLSNRPEYKTRVSSPIFDEVLKLRGNVKGRNLAGTNNDTKEVVQDDGQGENVEQLSVEEVKETTRSKTPDFIPDMEVAEENWAQPLYELAAPERRGNRSSREVDPIDALSDATVELKVVQEIGPSSRGDKVEIVTPPLMDVDLESGTRSGKKPDVAPRDVDEITEVHEAHVEKSVQCMSSKSSFKFVESVSSDDFEKVDKPAAVESEENGGRRKWYKGFRR